MTQPARQNHKAVIFAQQQRQLWVVCTLILLGLLWDFAVLGSVSPPITTKNLTAGAMLGFLGNLVFTRIAYRRTGAKARQAVMLNMYLGQMIKWFLCFTIVAQRQHVAYGGVNGIFTPNCKPSVRKKHIFSLHIGFGAIKYQ